VVAGKHPALQCLEMDAAARHCAAGISRWPWASSHDDGVPDLVMAAGDVPTLETLAATIIGHAGFSTTSIASTSHQMRSPDCRISGSVATRSAPTCISN
jgi:xylulose-5-phosphate/fructose-6-phosphate phosphoketolase